MFEEKKNDKNDQEIEEKKSNFNLKNIAIVGLSVLILSAVFIYKRKR